MITLTHKQGSPEWIRARLGLPTASQFHRIITPKTRKASGSQDAYLHELLAEYLLNAPVDDAGSGWTDRGTLLEGSAVAWYELQRDVTVDRVGLCLRDDRRAGCSPDGLIGSDGGLELKCPKAANHVANLLSMTSDYFCQVQGGLWITGRGWWDLVSYNPDLPSVAVRIERDEAFIAALEEHVLAFCARLDDTKAALAARGITPVRTESVRTAPEYPF